MPIVAFDDIVFKRSGVLGTFKAPLGVALTILDEAKFRQNYDSILDDLFPLYQAERKKRVYKAAHLVGQLLDSSTEFIETFLKMVSRHISRIDVFYSYFPSEIVPRIYAYGDTHPRSYKPEDFIDLIQNSYVHICVWRYLQLYPDCKDYKYHVDYFEGKCTPAWETIRDMRNLHLYNSGGECNYFISCADICLRHVQSRLKGALIRENILECFADIRDGTHVNAHWLGPKKEFLNSMAPNKDINANVRPKIKHPIFIIAWKSYARTEDEKTSFEWSSTYSKIMERAVQSDACVRFWDPKEGPHFVKEDEDLVVLANELARPIVESIKVLFPSIKIIESKDI